MGYDLGQNSVKFYLLCLVVVGEFGEEEGVLAGGRGEGSEQAEAGGQVRCLAVNGVVEKVEKGLG